MFFAQKGRNFRSHAIEIKVNFLAYKGLDYRKSFSSLNLTYIDYM